MHKYPRTIVLTVALIVIIFVLAACSGQDSPTATPVQIEVSADDEAEPVDEPEEEEEQEIQEEATATLEATATVENIVTNAVLVENQSLSPNGTVTISSVTADETGWLVIHAQADGKPGAILGYSPVQAGETSDLVVEIDSSAATETLYAMLHVDTDTEGMLDFPGGGDVPATDAAGNVVTPAFSIIGGQTAGLSVNLSESDELGVYLTDADGMSLYTFGIDVPGTSNCYDSCAAVWPPLLVEDGAELSAGEGIPGVLATTQRDDDTLQVTYNGWPLYYWINDEVPGDTKGHNVNNIWAVAYPTTQVFLGGNDDLGSFLVGSNGMTLYRFNADELGVSNCYDQCADNWPPLLLEDGEAPGGNAGVVGKLGTAEREDGTVQITYAGMPLYYWVNDSAPGDATGHGVNNIWFVVPPLTVRTGSSEELGSFLVGANGMTLYQFTVDEEGVSNCYDQCAENWPPLLVQPGETPVAGAGISGELGITEREDGSLQVTYSGAPLYYWINDEAPGDTTGQGVNDVWFVVEP